MNARPGPAIEPHDLALVLALARERTLARAAEALAVDTSTVFRRLNQVEGKLRVRLFDRSPHGYTLTEAGRLAAAAAERMETAIHELDRAITGRDQQLSGSVRLTASETLSYAVLPPLLAKLRQAHPGIQLALTIDNRVLDLGRREAEIALRTRRPVEADLFGRKLTAIAWSFYGATRHRAQLRRSGARWDFGDRPLIAWDEPSASILASTWLEERLSSPQTVYRSNSLVNQLLAAQAGIGTALLPCYLADPAKDLARVSAPIEELRGELWIVTHKALKATARVRACLTYLGDGILAQRSLFEGRGPGSRAKS
jgi:DNA-binding transcriptional LysR family regulator